MTTGNDTEFARYLGVNKSSVSRARKAGRLVFTADGRVDFEASAQRWHETSGGRTDVAARHAANRGSAVPTHRPGQKNAPAARAEAGVGQEMESGSADSARSSAKAALLHYENSLIKLEMALRRGLRLDRKAVGHEALGLGAMLRAGIERVIDQTAPRIAAARDAESRQRILASEIGRLRWIIKREMPRALRRMREAGQKASAE